MSTVVPLLGAEQVSGLPERAREVIEYRKSGLSLINRPQLTRGLRLAAVPTAVRLARLFVRQCLSLWGLSQLINDAELVLSELVTNAVNVTGSTNPRPRWTELHNLALIAVRLVVTADSLVVEVWDRDPSPPVLKQPEQADEAGRGLLIVGALCRCWGYFYPETGGKAVWGELVIPEQDLLSSGYRSDMIREARQVARPKQD